MVRTAINVYSVRRLDVSVPELIETVAEAGYDGIQFSGRHTPLAGDSAAIGDALDDTELDVAPPHVGIDDIEENLGTVVSTYEPLGVREAVVPYLPQSAFESTEAIERTVSRLGQLSETLDDENWRLHYHNHDHEFADSGGPTGFEALAKRTEMPIELDVGWARYAGRDPVALIEEYGDRMPLIHMKDVDVEAERGACFREIGDGDVDMRGCADAARDAGAEWLIYEHDDPEDPRASIRTGAEFLDSL